MIRQLAQCPYCQGCEIALTESLELAFNPESPPSRPCVHLILVEGRYSQWGLSPLPGRKTQIARMIGSNDFSWAHPGLECREDAQDLYAFLKELSTAGVGWELAPRQEHAVRIISKDHTITDAHGKSYPDWEIEGMAVFARDPEAFIAELPSCLERRSSPFADLPEWPPA
jgi:hypothetical protein